MASLNDAVEEGFIAVLETDTPEDLAAFAIVPSKNYDPQNKRQNPVLIVDTSAEARRRPQPGAYDVGLKLVLVSDVESDGDGATHKAAISALLSHIDGKPAVLTAINTDNADAYLYDYLLETQGTRIIESGEWETEIALNVVAQAR